MNTLRNKWISTCCLLLLALGSIVPANGSLSFCLCDCLCHSICDGADEASCCEDCKETESHCCEETGPSCSPPESESPACCSGEPVCPPQDPCDGICCETSPCAPQEFASYSDAVLTPVELDDLDPEGRDVDSCFDHDTQFVHSYDGFRHLFQDQPPDWWVAWRAQMMRC